MNIFHLKRFMVIVGVLTLAACSAYRGPVYKGMGSVMINYSTDYVIPYMVEGEDFSMACSVGEGLSPFLFSFEQVAGSLENLKVLMWMLSASCDTARANEAELRYLRALKANVPFEAQDARIEQKRLLSRAAFRYWQGYQAMVAEFGPPVEECPEFENEQQELYWMVGLMNGLQALISDTAAERAVGVPLNTASEVVRGSACLDGKKWWGLPLALDAGVRSLMPGDSKEAFLKTLQIAEDMGIQQQVRLASVIQAQVYLSSGDKEAVRASIARFFAEPVNRDEENPWKLFDQAAVMHMTALSDVLWTEATGARTPSGKLGHFWDEKKQHKIEGIDISDFL